MSRLDGRWAQTACDTQGQPVRFTLAGTKATVPVLAIRRHWREWLGALDGEPERDIWQAETPQGVCELHCVRAPVEDRNEDGDEETGGGQWLLFRWED